MFGISPDKLALSPSTVLQNIIQEKQLAARERERSTSERLALKRIALTEASQAEQARQFEVGRTEMTPYQKEVTSKWGQMTEAQKIQAKINIAAEARAVAGEKRKADTYKQEQDWREGAEPTTQPTEAVTQPIVQPITAPKNLQQKGYEDLADQWNLADNEVKRLSKETSKKGYKRKEWLREEKTRKANLVNAKEAKISARTAGITRKRNEPRLSIAQEMALKQQRNQALSVINTGTIETKDETGQKVVRPIKSRAEMKNTVLALGIDVDTDTRLKAALDKKYPAYKEVDQAIDKMFVGGKALTAEEIAEEITFINNNTDLKANEKKSLIKKIQSKQIKIETILKVPAAQRLGKGIGKLVRGITPKPFTTVEKGIVAAGGTLGLPAVMTKRLGERFGSKMGANLAEFMKGLAGE